PGATVPHPPCPRPAPRSTGALPGAHPAGGQGRSRARMRQNAWRAVPSGHLVRDVLFLEILAVEGDAAGLLVHHGVEVHRATPDPLDVPKRVAGVVVLQLDALVFVLQQELSLVPEIVVDQVDERLPEVCEMEQQVLLLFLVFAVAVLILSL